MELRACVLKYSVPYQDSLTSSTGFEQILLTCAVEHILSLSRARARPTGLVMAVIRRGRDVHATATRSMGHDGLMPRDCLAVPAALGPH